MNNSSPTDPRRAHVWVTGRVQGVGFRAYVQRCALETGVTGWVRNVGYSRVEAVAEGNETQVQAFVQKMVRGPSASRVDEWREDPEPPTGEFSGFKIKSSL